MELQEIAPKDLIESTWLDSYEQNIDALWWQLVRLDSTIFVLEKIISFPFDLFLPLPKRHFWNLVENTLFEMCVLIIWKVAVDNKEEGLTLQQIKNKILQHLRKEDYRDQFRRALKNVDFEKTVSTFKHKITHIRHNYIAHFNLNANVNPTPEQIRERTLLFPELKKYRDIIKSFFDLLCFGHRKALKPIEYEYDNCSDIEQLLDNFAKDSALLNLPEKEPDYWPIHRENLSEQELEILNKYRTKFGLSEVG